MTDLNFHIRQRAHYGSQRLKCETCGKSYLDRYTLRRHVKQVHEGVRVGCEFCKLKISINSMRRHIDIFHNKLKPSNNQDFKCEDCDNCYIVVWQFCKSPHYFSQKAKI